MKKLKRNWYQPEAVLPHRQTQSAEPAVEIAADEINEAPAADTATVQSSMDAAKELRQSLLADLHRFKHDKLYDEALACIQTLFDLKSGSNDLIYETAELHFLKEDYTGCYSHLQRFIAAEPLDARGSLLMTQLLLQFNQRDEAIDFLNKLLGQNIQQSFSEEKFYQSLDELISKLKRSIKAEKLLRRCPKLADYEKLRRRILRSAKQKAAQPEKTAADDINKGGIIMDELTKTIAHVWDMQRVNSDDTAVLLSAKADRLSDCIFCQVLSYKKKIWLFNCIAAALYRKGKIDTAVHLLRQAMMLDDENDLILKNLGYLLCQKGEYSAAQAVLSDIAAKDLATEDLLKKCQSEL